MKSDVCHIKLTIPHHNASANVSNLCRSVSIKFVIEPDAIKFVIFVEGFSVVLSFSTRNKINDENIKTKNPI